MPTLSKSYELCKFSCVGSIRGIPSGRRWAHHARSGSQSEHRILFIFPACAAGYMKKCLTEQDIYWPIICYPISRSQVPTCCLFSTQESNWTIERQHSTRWSVDGLMNLHCFPLAPYDRFISSRTEILGKHIFYSWSNVYISSFVFISSAHREGRKWIDK